ncbi:hypothetical protein [Lactiplantibacillus plantarum]|uniref:hypothetical protein n=1 Tax=Lactiplantibacillus plantarum TaxID=1590 RepID=UPI0021CB853A|nr:hypothetical protein [Lactiplantibacillus plantarum]
MRKSGAEYVVILGTQNVNNIDISALWRYHQQRNNEMTTVYKFLPAEQVAADDQVVTLTEYGKATSILPLAEANIPGSDDGAKKFGDPYDRCASVDRIITRG